MAINAYKRRKKFMRYAGMFLEDVPRRMRRKALAEAAESIVCDDGDIRGLLAVALYSGLSCRPHTYRQIADLMGITPSAAHELRRKGMFALAGAYRTAIIRLLREEPPPAPDPSDNILRIDFKTGRRKD